MSCHSQLLFPTHPSCRLRWFDGKATGVFSKTLRARVASPSGSLFYDALLRRFCSGPCCVLSEDVGFSPWFLVREFWQAIRWECSLLCSGLHRGDEREDVSIANVPCGDELPVREAVVVLERRVLQIFPSTLHMMSCSLKDGRPRFARGRAIYSRLECSLAKWHEEVVLGHYDAERP